MSGRPKIKITESRETLRVILKQQTKILAYNKVQMLYLFQSNQVETVREVAAVLGKGEATIHRWLFQYKEGGMENLLKNRQIFGRPKKFSVEIAALLQQELRGCISLWRICQKRVKMKKLVKSSNKDEVKKMTPSDQQQLKAHLKAAAEILYRNTDPIELKSFESIEKSVRQKMLEEVGPELGSFFFQQYQEFKQENPEK